jgi:hypothetical protein
MAIQEFKNHKYQKNKKTNLIQIPNIPKTGVLWVLNLWFGIVGFV